MKRAHNMQLVLFGALFASLEHVLYFCGVIVGYIIYDSSTYSVNFYVAVF
jgi:hypothetical protein